MTARERGQSTRYSPCARQAIIIIFEAHGALRIGVVALAIRTRHRQGHRVRTVAPHAVHRTGRCTRHPQLNVATAAEPAGYQKMNHMWPEAD